MSDEQAAPNDKGPAPVTIGQTSSTELGLPLVPASEVKPEDVGKLVLTYPTDGQPSIVYEGGAFVPASLPVTNESGAVVATYEIKSLPVDEADRLEIAAFYAHVAIETGGLSDFYESVHEAE